MNSNPFRYLLPVPPKEFIGRWPRVKYVASDLCAHQGDSYAVIGGRRFGKTSFLLALHHYLQKPQNHTLGTWHVLPLLIDFKRGFESPGQFYADVVWKLDRRLSAGGSHRPKDAWPAAFQSDLPACKARVQSQELTMREFEDCLRFILNSLDNTGESIRLVILLDEVDEVLSYDWKATLFNQLRALICSIELMDRVRIVLSGSRRFFDTLSDRGSPLWNIIKPEFLITFSDDGSEKLFAKAKGLPCDVKQVVRLQSGGHPHLTQYLLYKIWEIGTEMVTSDDVDRITDTYYVEYAANLEGWAQSIGVDGCLIYDALIQADDWLDELDIMRRVGNPLIRVKHGLTALCYHGLAFHDGNWSRFQHVGELFRSWFVQNRTRLLHPTQLDALTSYPTDFPTIRVDGDLVLGHKQETDIGGISGVSDSAFNVESGQFHQGIDESTRKSRRDEECDRFANCGPPDGVFDCSLKEDCADSRFIGAVDSNITQEEKMKKKSGKESTSFGDRTAIQGDVFSGKKRTSVKVGDISNISGSQINIAGEGISVSESSSDGVMPLDRIFLELKTKVDALPEGPDRNIAQSAVQGLEAEAKKGNQADERNVDRWFNFLAQTAPDAFEVAVNSFINPILGISTAFQKVAERAKEETKGSEAEK